MAYFIHTVWTPDKWSRAKEMRAEGYTREAIAEEVGVSVTQVRNRFQNSRGEDLGRHPTRVSVAQIEEREARRTAADMRDTTAVLCGDPPKGFSALDKRVRS